MAFFTAIYSAISYVFSSTSIAATAIRFVAVSLIEAAAGQKAASGPKLSDLKVQTSSYGVTLPKLYGKSVRVAGNVIDKADLIEVKKHKGGFFGLFPSPVYTYQLSCMIALGEGPLPVTGLKRIWANGRLVFDASVTAASTTNTWGQSWDSMHTGYVFGVRFYRGDDTQPVDATVSAWHDPADVLPAYRGTCCVVIQQFKVKDFGNSVPSFEFEVATGIERLGDIVADLAAAADVEVYDNRLDDVCRGYAVSSASAVWDAIQPLAGAFSFDLVSRGSRFEAIPRGRFMRTVIPATALGAVTSKDKPTDTKTVSVTDPRTLPDVVTISYLDPARDYQVNTQSAFRNTGTSLNVQNVDVPVVLSGDEAKRIAYRTLMESQVSGHGDKFTISEKYRWLEAGDIVGISLGGNVEPVRIVSITRGANLIIEIVSVFEDPLAYNLDYVGTIGTFPETPLYAPGLTTMYLLDTPPVFGDDDFGAYLALQPATGFGWAGADIERSLDGGTTYSFLDSSSNQGVIGNCTTTLGTGPVDVWDRHSTLIVNFPSGTPATATEAAVLNGANLAWIGKADGSVGEFINFATVTQVGSPLHYQLSNLLRGRFGTEWAVATHAAAEIFVLFSDDNTQRFQFALAEWNATRQYKAVTIDTLDTLAPVDTFTNTGEGKRCLAPVLMRGLRNGSNSDVLIAWTRRTRAQTPVLGGGLVPLGEVVESYEVDIFSGATVVRTLTSAVQQVNYTSAQQTADGLTPGAPVKCSIYQINDARGRGHPANATL